MSIVLQSSAGGQITIQEPATASNFTQTLPAATGTVALTNAPVFTGQATIPTINLTGGQITFPATQSASSDANTLDDYEEGTWTPILGRFATDPTITYSDRRGRYVKIGSMVHCMAFFSVSSISAAGSGLNQLAGLPFASEGAGSTRWTLNLGLNESLTSANTGYVIANATFAFFYNLSTQANPNANYATGQMYISFSYQTT